MQNSNSTQYLSPLALSQSQNQSPPQLAPENLSDKELYEKCQLYGAAARLWRQKFAGLLPEVFRRRLYVKKGFGSIHEFAAKLAGMSERQVDVVLNLEKKFEDKPILKSMLETGEVSANKLVRVAAIATSATEEFWSTRVKLLPKTALETLVRDEKARAGDAKMHSQREEKPTRHSDEKAYSLYKEKRTRCGACVVPGHHANGKSVISQELNLSVEVQQKLLELQNKGIDINSLLLDFLEERELKIAQKKESLSAETQSTRSRYIPIAIRKILKEEYGEKCSIPMCRRPVATIHHTQRFSLSQNHDPRFLAPLCEEHHVIAHSVDLKYHRAREDRPATTQLGKGLREG